MILIDWTIYIRNKQALSFPIYETIIIILLVHIHGPLGRNISYQKNIQVN